MANAKSHHKITIGNNEMKLLMFNSPWVSNRLRRVNEKQ